MTTVEIIGAVVSGIIILVFALLVLGALPGVSLKVLGRKDPPKKDK